MGKNEKAPMLVSGRRRFTRLQSRGFQSFLNLYRLRKGTATNPTSPKHLRGRAISPKAPRPQSRTAVGPDVRGHGRHSAAPLGDRLLPRKSSVYIRITEKSTSPKHLRGRAISPKAPRPQSRTAANAYLSETGSYLGGLRAASGRAKTNCQ
jgi:hypothetical protein